MRILISNQKGGTGKSTLILLLANYLAAERRRKVAVLDMAEQSSVWNKSEKAKLLENTPLYPVQTVTVENFAQKMQSLQTQGHEIVLIDMPSVMEDDRLLEVLSSAELVICPFAYDEFTVDSTVLFALFIGRINKRAPLMFVPNRIKSSARYELRAEVDKVLRRLGTVAPSLPDRVDIQRINTLHTPEELKPLIAPMLDLLYEQYMQGHLR